MSLAQLLIFLAQSSDTNADEIFTRILFAFCSIGLIWLAIMGALIYRGIENRRRAAAGIEPLPPLWTWTYHLILRVVNPGALPDSAKQPRPTTKKKGDAPPSAAPAWDASMPAPDLDMLMGEFGAPEFADFGGDQPMVEEDDDDLSLDFGAISEPASTIPVVPSRQIRDPEQVDLAGEFALDDEDTPAPVADDAALAPEPDPDREPEFAPEPEIVPVVEDPVMADTPPDAVELLRVWRDISDGSLILEIKGRQFRSLADLRDADLERRLINVVKELVQLVKSGGPARSSQPRAQAPAPAQSSQPQPQAQPQTQAQPVKPRPDSQPKPAQPKAAPAEKPDSQPARKLHTDEMPSMAPGDMFRQMGQIAFGRKQDESEEEPLPEPLSIPEQINAVLQQRLRTMPEYRGREIEVQPSLGGLVIIKVDGKFYEGVGEVAEDDVRALLQDVVREWENSQ
ncbi:MAG: hypothetical protein JXA10_16080 [Anaerolineae bacterium]|nr:hypothetical protein [Anaerolineae bacterium]